MDKLLIKEKIIFIIKVIVIILFVIIILWGLLFLVDYLLFKYNNQTLFTITKVDNNNGNYTTTRKGLGYKYITKDDKTTIYLFDKEIK